MKCIFDVRVRWKIRSISLLCILALLGTLAACSSPEDSAPSVSDQIDTSSRTEENFTIQQPSTGVPLMIEYQGYLTDPGGAPRAFEVVDMVFRIYQYESEGSFDWSETHFGVQTGAEGRFRVLLNSTGGASGDLANLVRSSSQIWLELEVNGEILTPRQRIASVAYALSAPWSGLVGIPADFADGVDNTAGLAGEGLTLSNNIFELAPGYRLPQSCSNNDVPIWDTVSGTWLCGLDSGETYTAGEGLLMDGTQFRVIFGGNGNASSAARSDHDHAGQTWTTAQQPGLKVKNTNATDGTIALHGDATEGGDAIGVKGDGTKIGVKGEAWGDSPSYGVYGRSEFGTGVYGEVSSRVTGLDPWRSSVFGVYSQGPAHVEGFLEVSKSIHVQDYIKVENPKLRWTLIPPQVFRPAESSYDSRFPLSASGGLRHYSPEQGIYLAPVLIPAGASIVSVTLHCIDKHNEDAILYLYGREFGDDPKEEIMAEVRSSGNTGYGEYTDESVGYGGVGYGDLQYFLLSLPAVRNYEQIDFLGVGIWYRPDNQFP